MFLSPAANSGFWCKTTKMTSLHSAHKNKNFAHQTPEDDENDENGGVALEQEHALPEALPDSKEKNIERQNDEAMNLHRLHRFHFIASLPSSVRKPSRGNTAFRGTQPQRQVELAIHGYPVCAYPFWFCSSSSPYRRGLVCSLPNGMLLPSVHLPRTPL